MISLIIGLITGCIFGFIVAAILAAGKSADDCQAVLMELHKAEREITNLRSLNASLKASWDEKDDELQRLLSHMNEVEPDFFAELQSTDVGKRLN